MDDAWSRLVAAVVRAGWVGLARMGRWTLDGSPPGDGRLTPGGAPARAPDLPYSSLVQCDGTTCGSACLVVARMTTDPQLAAALLAADGSPAERFAAAQRAVHRRTGRLRTSAGWAVPWPRRLGTTPWGAARELRAIAPTSRVVLVDPTDTCSRRLLFDAVVRTVTAGRPAAVFVGSQLAPRHVVLALAADARGLVCYEPSAGALLRLGRSDVVDGPLVVAGWSRVWAAVVA